jgi:SpoIIAA-like
MSVHLQEKDGGKVLEIRVSGKLAHEDYEQLVPEFERLIKQHGQLRLLFEMKDFHGWTAGALWDDFKVGLKHFADIERLAMVGDKRWEQGMSVFCRPFTTARIRYFDRAAIEEARAWLDGP